MSGGRGDGTPPLNRKDLMLMNKIDYRRHYVLVLDTETANTFTDENGTVKIK